MLTESWTVRFRLSNFLWAFQVVEAAGIEPASENLLMQLSPGAEYLLYFPQVPPVLRLCLSVAF